MWRFPTALARTLRCSNAEGMGRGLRGIEWPNATRRATHSDMPARKRREPAIYRLGFTDIISVFVDFALRHIRENQAWCVRVSHVIPRWEARRTLIEDAGLGYPYDSYPAIKIARLAVDKRYSDEMPHRHVPVQGPFRCNLLPARIKVNDGHHHRAKTF